MARAVRIFMGERQFQNGMQNNKIVPLSPKGSYHNTIPVLKTGGRSVVLEVKIAEAFFLIEFFELFFNLFFKSFLIIVLIHGIGH